MLVALPSFIERDTRDPAKPAWLQSQAVLIARSSPALAEADRVTLEPSCT